MTNQESMELELPEGLEPAYANITLITTTLGEIIFDFAQAMPRMPQAKIKARVVLAPRNAKALSDALAKHMAEYEETNGAINMGAEPADEFFKGKLS